MSKRGNYIIFEGVSSCVELFVNGEYIGFSTVSHCMSEFKIPLEEGENVICTPKVRHFWRCIFLWQRKGKNIENTRQNSNYLL